MLTTVTDYAAVLAALQQVAPEAHIAGGAVRDTILNKLDLRHRRVHE